MLPQPAGRPDDRGPGQAVRRGLLVLQCLSQINVHKKWILCLSENVCMHVCVHVLLTCVGYAGSRVQDVLVIPEAHLWRVCLIQLRKEKLPFLGARAKRMNLRGTEEVELVLL